MNLPTGSKLVSDLPIGSRHRRCCDALILACVFGAQVMQGQAPAQPRQVATETLPGTVRTEAGDPIADAAVVISWSYLRGKKLLDWRFSHADCLKYAFTDKSGVFAIPAVEAERTLTMVVAASGYGTKLIADVDPQAKPRTIVLSPPQLQTIERASNDVWGHVVDPEGAPIAGAIIVPRSYLLGDTGFEGRMDTIAETTVTNSDGEFRVPSAIAVSALHLEVSARGFVPQFFKEVSNGGDEQTLTLKRGATLQGRILRDGVPQCGIVVGANVAQRYSGSWNGPWGTLTDRDGRFTLAHVVPDKEVCVFATMESVGGLGAAPQTFVTAADETNIDLGDMRILDGHRLCGRVMVEGDGPLPPNVHIIVWRDGSENRITAPVSSEGEFEIRNVPPEIVMVSARALVEGTERTVWPWPFHLSNKNVSLDPHNPQHLLGLLSEDTEVTILLAPGKFEFPPAPANEGEWKFRKETVERLRKSPLQGVDIDGLPRE